VGRPEAEALAAVVLVLVLMMMWVGEDPLLIRIHCKTLMVKPLWAVIIAIIILGGLYIGFADITYKQPVEQPLPNNSHYYH
jgi:hypothetical protein